MRPLIRPTLFAIARLGLFLAVAAWIVGQWWSLQINPHTGDSRIFVTESGFVHCDRPYIRWLPDYEWKTWAQYQNARAAVADWNASHAFTDRWIQADSAGHNKLHTEQESAVSIPHWLIVTVVALLYAVLKWVYREQPEVK